MSVTNRFILFSSLVFASFGVLPGAGADIPPVDATFRTELLVGVEKSLAEIRNEKDLAAKRTALKGLNEFIEKKLSDVETSLKAAEKKGQAELREREEKKETEALHLHLAFERVFDSLLSNSFLQSAEYKRQVCKNLPHDIEFAELANQPAGSRLSAYRRKAIEVLAEFCPEKPNSATSSFSRINLIAALWIVR